MHTRARSYRSRSASKASIYHPDVPLSQWRTVRCVSDDKYYLPLRNGFLERLQPWAASRASGA